MDSNNKGCIKRTTNFTKSEENYLLQLIKKYGHILENKRTDSASNQNKNEAWLKVTREFNSSDTTYRSLQVLKNKYLNMKKKTLKGFSEEKRDTYLTGGGPPVPWHDTETDQDIREILGSRVTGFGSQFDDDVEGLSEDNNSPSVGMEQFDKEQVTVIIEQNDDSNIEYEIEDTELCGEKEHYAIPSTSTSTSAITSSNVMDWSKSSAALIRTPVSKRLQVNNPSDTRKRDNTLRTKKSNWAKLKQDYV